MFQRRLVPFSTVAAIAAVTASCFAAAGETPADRRFDELAARYIDQFPAFSPVSATLLGDHRFDGRLDRVNASARDAEARFLRSFLEQLAEIEPRELGRAKQVDYAMLRHHLQAQLWHLETLQEWAWNPLSYTRLSGSAIYGLMARQFAPLEERLARVAERLEQFPRLFDEIRAALRPARVPEVHARTAVDQNRGVLSMLENMVKPCLDRLSEDERSRLEKAMTVARDAVDAHQKWLEAELLPRAGGDFRLGADLYDEKLSRVLQTSFTRAEIRQRAERQLREVRERMYEIAKGIYRHEYPYTEFPSDPSDAYRRAIIRACLELAYAERPRADGIVEAAKHSLELATDFVHRQDLVTLPPDPLEIIVMPEFERGVSLAYCDSPGPLDVGQKTFYAVAPLPDDWTPAQARSFLREYNVRSIHNLTIHEAMPGHFLQLSHSNRYPGKLRAVLSSGVFVEGWAVYTEWMMCERGFLDGDPLMQLIVLKWYLRDTTNAILDQAVHVDGVAEKDALGLLMEDAFQEEREAAGKWKRAQLTSAQLSTYFVGYLEHVELRREVEELRGTGFDLKTYHDEVLSFGSPPVQFVRALMLDREIPLPDRSTAGRL